MKQDLSEFRYKSFKIMKEHLPKKEWFVDMFINKNKSANNIAEKLKIPDCKVYIILKYFKIKKKTKKFKPPKPKKWFLEQVIKRRTIRDISKELKIDEYITRNCFYYYNLLNKGEIYNPLTVLRKSKKNTGIVSLKYDDPTYLKSARKEKYLLWLKQCREQDKKELRSVDEKIKRFKIKKLKK